jgi:hypothetical protein
MFIILDTFSIPFINVIGDDKGATIFNSETEAETWAEENCNREHGKLLNYTKLVV